MKAPILSGLFFALMVYTPAPIAYLPYPIWVIA